MKIRSVKIKCHDVETSLLEGVLSRGDRRVADGDRAGLAARRAARRLARARSTPTCGGRPSPIAGIDIEALVHRPYELNARLPWDHINVKKGRAYLEKEQHRSVVQLAAMADAQ